MSFRLVGDSAWDLGVYTQALSNFAAGHLFYTNLLGGDYLSEHFSPFLFVLGGLYYLFPSAYTLLIIQAFVIGMSAAVLYLISYNILSRLERNKISDKTSPEFISAVISIIYLLSPLTESPIFFDFHLMVFLPLFFFLAIYFFLKKNYLLNIVFLALIVSLHSSFVFIVITTILMELFMNNTLNHRDGKHIIKDISIFTISILILGFYYIMAGMAKNYISGIAISGIPHIHVTGSVGPLSLITDIFTDPAYVVHLLIAFYPLKLLILVLAFGGTAFLFLRYIPSVFSFIPYILYSMFSTYQSYFTIGYQYTMMFIPMVALSAVMGFYMLSKKRKNNNLYKKQVTAAIIAMFIISAIGFGLFAPLSPVDITDNNLMSFAVDYGNSSYMEQINFEHKVANSIGPKASIITDNNLFPLFGNDPNANAFPYEPNIVVNGSYYQYLFDQVNSMWSIDNHTINGHNVSLNDMEKEYKSSGNYGIYAEGYGIIVLERGYTGKPLFA